MQTRVTIIGAGIAGLATAAWLEHDHGITDVLILEAGDMAGGKLRTRISCGHCVEWGPQGFLNNAPDTLELVELAGAGPELVRADDASADRFIVRDGRLRAVPLSPPAFLTSDILPLRHRLRLLLEPLGPGPPKGDESVFDFARRRIGRGAAEVLVDAMVTGVFAGDSRRLSLAATFPRMAAMEARHGSLTRALLAKRREARKAGRTSAGPAGPGGTLTTLRQGMGQLAEALVSRLGDRLRLGSPARAVERRGSSFAVATDALEVATDSVVVALPAAEAATVLRREAPDAVEPLSAIPSTPVAVVLTSYADPSAFGRPLNGFGFLVPSGEAIPVLGTLFCHSIFPGQAPPGHVFLRTMLAGMRDPAAIELDDEALLDRVRQALVRVLGRDPDPDLSWVIRHHHGIAQYSLGHLDRVQCVEKAVRDAGLEITGSSLRGVSVNDCIRNARATATRVADRLSRVTRG